MEQINLVWLALLFPALGLAINTLISRRFPAQLAGVIASIAVGLSFVVAVIVFVGLQSLPEDARRQVVPLWTWIVSGDLTVQASLLVDPLSTLMLLVVTGVSFLIHVYATGYMHGDPGERRFFAYMNLFVLSMLVLVLADNFLMLMVGWNGVGLSSYLLIAFWFERPEAARAGVKAFIVNAIGDVGLLLAVFLIFLTFGSLEYDRVFQAASGASADLAPIVTTIALLLLVAAAAKSAQLPLYVWLPDAMAGPTPVSALIHAATMVTAGVYLIARAHPLYSLSPTALAVVAWIGGLTALFAATIGLVKPNIKRVLAYSTVSQLGYMFLGVGVGAYAVGIFHLMTHAFFKAVLFLAAGAVIHALGGEEDMRRMGGLRERLPLVYWTFVAGALALAGFPFTSGFFSKDEIIGASFFGPNAVPVLGVVALLTAGLTAFYVFRAVFLTFHGKPQGHGHGLHLPGAEMTVPLVVLAMFAIGGGWVAVDGSFEHFLHPVFAHYGGTPYVPTLNLGLAAVSSVLSIAGIVCAYAVYGRDATLARRLGFRFAHVHQFLLNDWYVERLYQVVIVRPTYAVADIVGNVLDNQVVDGIVNGIAAMTRGLGSVFGRLQTGNVRSYALGILVGAVAIIAYLGRVGG